MSINTKLLNRFVDQKKNEMKDEILKSVWHGLKGSRCKPTPLSPEAEAEIAEFHRKYQEEYAADKIKMDAFVVALNDLSKEHGVTIDISSDDYGDKSISFQYGKCSYNGDTHD